MPERPAITSSELGVLWNTYQQKTMIIHMLQYFIEKADDAEAKQIMSDLLNDVSPFANKIKMIFQEEGAVVPIGFSSEDVFKNVPELYANGFDIMFVRLIKEISMAMHTLNLTMAYREDIIKLFRDLTIITQKYYDRCTRYLLEKGLIARPPFVSMPKTVEFVKDSAYLGGLLPFKDKRPLNTVEVSNIFHAIESNLAGMQMILGFSQCAQEPEVKQFFTQGARLAKKIVQVLSEKMLESDVQVPAGAGGNVTASSVAPFSDKVMMYCVSLFCSFSLGGNSLGTAFSLRNDLPATFASIMKDVFDYAHDGALIMIKNGWMEEPPQMKKHAES